MVAVPSSDSIKQKVGKAPDSLFQLMLNVPWRESYETIEDLRYLVY